MGRERWIRTCDHVIPSRTAAGRRVLDQLLDQLRRERWVQHDVFSVQLAVEEALVNAIKHGNRLDQAKQVRVSWRMAPELLRVEITDEGPGFDPTAVPNPTDPDRLPVPHGRGLLLMRSFMTRVQYNKMGNRVVLEKYRRGHE